MLLTSQNRIAVIQANSADKRGQVLAAAVAHRSVSSKRPYSMRRTQLPFGPTTFRDSERQTAEGHRRMPAGCRQETALLPRLWASLVLSKTARG